MKNEIANVKGPHPQRGFSVAGDEQTSKLRKVNLQGRSSYDGLTDLRVSLVATKEGKYAANVRASRSILMPGRDMTRSTQTSGQLRNSSLALGDSSKTATTSSRTRALAL